MFENIIKGGIKPGMVLISDHATKLGSKETWIVFPNNYEKMHAVRFSGNYWDSLRQEGDLLYVGGYQIRRIYDSPRGALVANEALIWDDSKGVVNDKYKPINTVEDLIEAVENHTTEITNTYFY